MKNTLSESDELYICAIESVKSAETGLRKITKMHSISPIYIERSKLILEDISILTRYLDEVAADEEEEDVLTTYDLIQITNILNDSTDVFRSLAIELQSERN